MKLTRLTHYATALLFAVCLSMGSFGSLYGQHITLFIPDDTVTTTVDSFQVPILVSGVDSIVGFAFSMSWDPAVLHFNGERDVTFDSGLFGGFNRSQVDQGRLGYLLSPENVLVGLNAPDSTRLMYLSFSPVNSNEVVTQVSFVDEPLRLNASHATRGTLDSVDVIAGTITLMATTSTTVRSESTAFTIHPNPVGENSQITVALPYTSPATLEIIDANGRIIRRRALSIRAGEQIVDVDGTDFPMPGAYVLRLTTDREQLIRKVIRR